MGLIVDTSLVIKLEREGASIDFEPSFDPDVAAISAITVSELLIGKYRFRGEQRARRAAFIEAVIERFEAIPITSRIAKVHAEITATLMEAGQMVGYQDRWIAATAMASGSTLATLDRKDFDRIPGLHVVSPAD